MSINIPNDLVELPEIEYLSAKESEKIDLIPWYRPKDGSHLIFISASKLNECAVGLPTPYRPEDFGLKNEDLLLINRIL